MKMPEEFEWLGMCFFQGIDRECENDPEKCVEIGVRLFLVKGSGQSQRVKQNANKGKTVIAYIDELLSGKYNESELRSRWIATGGVALMPDHKMSNFLELIRKRIVLALS